LRRRFKAWKGEASGKIGKGIQHEFKQVAKRRAGTEELWLVENFLRQKEETRFLFFNKLLRR